MYNLHYNIWMKKFPNSKLLFTDTDSLAYEVTDHDVYQGMVDIRGHFDFSEYRKDHFLYNNENMKVVEKFKDECLGHLIRRFVGLWPKLYSFEYERIAFFDFDEEGNEIEVKKYPEENSVQKTKVDTKNGIRKGHKEQCLYIADY